MHLHPTSSLVSERIRKGHKVDRPRRLRQGLPVSKLQCRAELSQLCTATDSTRVTYAQYASQGSNKMVHVLYPHGRGAYHQQARVNQLHGGCVDWTRVTVMCSQTTDMNECCIMDTEGGCGCKAEPDDPDPRPNGSRRCPRRSRTHTSDSARFGECLSHAAGSVPARCSREA